MYLWFHVKVGAVKTTRHKHISFYLCTFLGTSLYCQFGPSVNRVWYLSAPISVADRALPVLCSHTHTAPAADAVAAATAHCPWIPKLSQRPLAAGASMLAVLPGGALCASPSKLLQLMLHLPEVRMDEIADIFNCQWYICSDIKFSNPFFIPLYAAYE